MATTTNYTVKLGTATVGVVTSGVVTIVASANIGPVGPTGATGATGATGTAATIAIGTTTTGAAGTSAVVSNSGSSSAAVLDFAIPQGVVGATGTAATIAVGTTTTGAAGSSASVTNAGTSSAATFNFTVPRGDTGATGATGTAATVTAGTTTTGAAGSSAAVTNSGTSGAAIFDFAIPRGDTGATGSTGATGTAATVAAGTTTTGAAGTTASVTNAGTSSAAVFNFTIPRGDVGDTGATGPQGIQGIQGITGATGATGAGVAIGGTAGQILSKIDATDYNTQWVSTVPSAAYTSVVKHEVKAGEAITKGQAVYVSSSSGTNMVVTKASNTSDATSSKTMGLLDASVILNDFANVITEGLITGLDTSTATAGDPVWLGTSGNLIYGLVSKPIAPNHLVYIGVVTRVSSTVGEIFVHVVNGFELEELHNVLITSPQDKDALVYNAATGLWKNTVASSDPMNDSKFSAIILMDVGV